MSTSFCIDFKSYALHLPVGLNSERLERNLDVMDLNSILIDEGFNHFDYPAVYHRVWGNDLNALREQVIHATLGVPRTALVMVRRLGNNHQQVLVAFKY